MQCITQQIAHHRMQEGGVIARIQGVARLVDQLQAFLLDRLTPEAEQIIRHLGEGYPGGHGGVVVLGACQHQEGLHQFAHFFAGPGDAQHLVAPTLVDGRVFQQQLAGTGQYHQRRAQFVAHITGKQLLAGQRLAQTAQCGVEGHSQLAHFIGGVIRCQGRRQAEQLVTMTHLARQAHHRCHHLAGQHPAEEDRQRQAEHEAHQHHREQHALTLFEIALVLQQHVTPTIDHFDHGVVRQRLAEHFMKTRFQVPQVLGQLEIPAPAAEIEQLVRLGSVAPVLDAVHQQQALQVAAQTCRNQLLFHQMHRRDDPHREGARHQCAHQGKGDDDPLGKALLKLHHDPRPGGNPHRVPFAAMVWRKVYRSLGATGGRDCAGCHCRGNHPPIGLLREFPDAGHGDFSASTPPAASGPPG